MPNDKLELTADGSHSVRSGKFDVLYHSMHGAIQESKHVFLRSGLDLIHKDKINILEMGFGTGLNMLLTLIENEKLRKSISYHSIEAYPLEREKVKQLNYLEILDRQDLTSTFYNFHSSDWNQNHMINDHFNYTKFHTLIQDIDLEDHYDLVYYDAFAPTTQEELWTPEIFTKIGRNLNPEAILVSYCAKGSFKRALLEAGFTIEKIPGPPGKREMIRGTYSIA